MSGSASLYRGVFVLPVAAHEQALYQQLLGRITASAIGESLVAALQNSVALGHAPPLKLAFDDQQAYGIGYCSKSKNKTVIALRRCLSHEEGDEIGLAVDDDLAVSALAHEMIHARQPRFGAYYEMPYVQTYLLFTSFMAECDAFAGQVLFALDSGDDHIIDATVHYLTRDMLPAQKRTFNQILDRWQPDATPAEKDGLLRDIFWFMHGSGYLLTYKKDILTHLAAKFEGLPLGIDIPPRGVPDPREEAPLATLYKNCLDFYVAMQSLPSLTGGRGWGDYLGDDHATIARQLLDSAIAVQYPDFSIDTSPTHKAKTVFKASMP